MILLLAALKSVRRGREAKRSGIDEMALPEMSLDSASYERYVLTLRLTCVAVRLARIRRPRVVS